MRLKMYVLHTNFSSLESDVTDSIVSAAYSVQTNLHEADLGFLSPQSLQMSPWCPTLFHGAHLYTKAGKVCYRKEVAKAIGHLIHLDKCSKSNLGR